jgi:hypothetical protein
MQIGYASAYEHVLVYAVLSTSLTTCPPHTWPALRYKCEGWSDKFPPALGVSLEQMIAGHDKFDLRNGTIREAVLRRYSDIDSYRTLRAQYYQAKGLTDDYQDISIQVGSIWCHAIIDRITPGWWAAGMRSDASRVWMHSQCGHAMSFVCQG